MSGVLPAVIAVVNLSCAASHGIAVTLTFTPGLAASNSLARSGSFSPSAPIAQTVRVPVAGPAATLLAVAVLVDFRCCGRRRAAPQRWSPPGRPRGSFYVASGIFLSLPVEGALAVPVRQGQGDEGSGLGVRATARAAQDELRGQDDWFQGAAPAGDPLVQAGGGELADLADRLTHRGEPGRTYRAAITSSQPVIARSSGTRTPARVRRSMHRQGQLVVGADDGVGVVVAREEPLREADAVGLFDGIRTGSDGSSPRSAWARRNPS